jgi:outer membrane protein assembly factor BamB
VRRGGSYIPTPVVLDENLYVNRINGVMTCFKAKSGEELYKQRVASADKPSGFWSSPVAANGKIYLAAESGDVYVVKAGDTYELLATNPIGEPCLSTPAISDGMIYIRTTHHLVAIAERR